eukprot:COSAG02_NODE_3144_length_7290_cov_18.513559_7_plen_90_part_00
MRRPGHAASGKERGKVLSYRGAMRRQEGGGLGWLARGAVVAADVFVPFGFEVGGALGELHFEWCIEFNGSPPGAGAASDRHHEFDRDCC